MSAPGKLITLEGIDGSGKSTVHQKLKKDLQDNSDVVFTREPTQDTFYGDAVLQSVATDDASSMAELFLYMADHAAHLEQVVEPALNAGKVVISDRYIGSRIAYQTVTLAEHLADPTTFIKNLHEPWSRHPDETIYLDVAPEVGAERSGKTNKFEQTEHLEAVTSAYEELIDEFDYTVVDGTASKDAVYATVLDLIQPYLE